MKKFIYSVLTVLTVSSCSEWLNLQPEDGVFREIYWKTKEETKAALNGCYASMMEDNVMLNYFIWGELRADMVEPTSLSNDDIIAIRDGEITSSNRYTKWEYFYRTINQCNTLIELAPLAKEKDMSFSETLLKQYQAEAVCIRSLAYFYLLRTFRDVPYITKASIYDDQNFSQPKTLQEDIVDSLIIGLLRVENDLPFTYNTTVESKGRFTAWGLKALLADIYLWKGDYQNCINLTTQIISSGQFTLIPVARQEFTIDANTPDGKATVYYPVEGDISNFFDDMYVKGNSVESILELQFEADKNNPFVSWFMPGSADLQAKMSNMYTEFFVSSALDRGWYDIRGEGVAFKQGYIWKWIGLSRDNSDYRPTTASNSNWIFYRLADIILMKAEAYTQLAKSGNNQEFLQKADSLIRQIRLRANAPESTDLLYGLSGDINTKTMEEFILAERAREFAFEGKRWFDVLRHARRDNYNEQNLDYLIRLAILSASPQKVTILQNKWKNNFGSHYLPIHIDEIKVNKNLIQNEFYN
ncbi:MAG: RagB/SusD family nutrient uptake outer membrane protein [Bacteroidales bacterium]|nr:RagB/SusD family nutrient uptake outer membrane protein [Bacteroidales bacterium]